MLRQILFVALLASMPLMTRVKSQQVPKGSKKNDRPRIAYTEPTSGARMFQSYCAACHGPQGKGVTVQPLNF